MGHSKWADLVAVSVLSHLLTVIAQPGFLSIDCGGTTNYTAENNITWIADTNYIEVGETAEIGKATNEGSYLHSLRYFPKPLNKSCYRLPVIPNVPYLVRLWFAVGNYTGLENLSSSTFNFSIETLGMLAEQNITISNMKALNHEKVLVSSGTVLYICLIRTSESKDPFISAIELRTLRDGMYQWAKPGILLSLHRRLDLGGNSLVRYPQDEFDRLWEARAPPADEMSISVKEPISTNNTKNHPPCVVMQTAWNNSSPYQYLPVEGQFHKPLLLLYFADIGPVNITFNVTINGPTVFNINMVGNYSAVEKAFPSNDTTSFLAVALSNNSPLRNNSTSSIVNALEIYSSFDTKPATYSKDFEALESLRVAFGIKDWVSDPCYLIPWKGIVCDNKSSGSSVVRISEM